MKNTRVARDLPVVTRRSRWSRLLISLAIAAAGASTSFAQSVGVTTYAGQALTSGLIDNATPTQARFNNPVGLAADATNLYVADSANNVIRRITISSGAVGTMATGFNGPAGVAVDGSGNAYVADTLNHVIKRVTSGGSVSILAGASGTSGSTNDTLLNSRFFGPQGIAVNSAGTFVYVADSGNNLVRRIEVNNATNTAVTTIASGFKPFGLALNAAGTMLYVADSNGHTIRSVNLSSGNALATVAGTLNTFGSTDSPALFRNPTAVSVDSAGDIYVADTGNHLIRKISGATVTTIAGTAGALGVTDGVGAAARFQAPSGIVATAVNTAFIADTNNHTIRRAAPATAPTITSANNAAFSVGSAGSFTVVANGSPAPTFSIISGALPSFATLNPTTGVISGTPSTGAGSPFTFTIQASNGVNPAATQSFTLTVNQPPSFTSLNSATFAVNSAGSFTVTATGSPAPTFSVVGGTFPPWASLDGATGAITGTPLNNTGSPFTFTLQASNGIGSPVTQSFTLTVNNGAGINTQPQNSATLIGQNATFTVVATGTPAPTYQWQRQAAFGGGFFNLPEGGTYTGTTSATLTVNSVSAAMNGDQFQVIVTNGIGSPVTSSVATLTAAQVPAITSAASTTFVVNQAGTFNVTSTGSPVPTYSITSGSFPPWASINSTTGAITGTPTNTTGSPFVFTITAANGISPAANQTFTLNVSLADVVAAIATQPVPATVQLGASASFTASATGSPTPTLRWQRQPSGTSGFVDLFDDGVYFGTTTNTLTINNVTAGMTNDLFRLVATNTVNGVPTSATSDAVALTVNIGTTITTFVGAAGQTGAVDGTGSGARFNTPASIAADPFGNFYVADTANHVIRKVTAAGVVTTFAGQPGSSGNTDGLASSARFNGPSAVAVDSIGNVYVADTYNHTIRVISSSGNVTTLAGLANNLGTTDGTGNAARFSFPSGIAIDASLNIYVSDTSNHTIRRVTTAGVVTTFAGTAGSAGSAPGFGTGARFAFPGQLAIGPGGVLYVADSFNHLIRRVSPSAEVSNYAGGAGLAGSVDGTAANARFNQPTGVAVDPTGVVYVADTFNNTVRRIATNGDVTTLAGSAGLAGSTDGVGSSARFNQPFGVLADANGNLYIADTRNNTIRRSGTTTAPAITTQPQNRTAPSGGSTTFTVVATGTPAPSYQWQRQPANSFGFVNLSNDGTHSGVNTATLTVTNIFPSNNGDQYRVIVTNGVLPAATSESATLTIGDLPVFTSAANATVRATEAVSFTATASGSPAPTFSGSNLPSWLIIAPGGAFVGTPPAGSEGTYTFTVNANNGATVSQTFTLVVTPAVTAPSISAQPQAVSTNQGTSASFSVTAAGTAPFTYQWFRNGAAITGATSALYTIANVQPSNAGNYSVTVTNAGGTATSVGAPLVVITAPSFTTQPQTQIALNGSTVTFSVSATGGAALGYQWRRNGVPIAGANGPTLILNGVSAADVGSYDVLVSNQIGVVTSSLAQLTIVSGPTAPTITSQPTARTVAVGSSTTLFIGATGVPAPSYQWRKDGNPIAGANGPLFVIGSAQTSDAGAYDVVVSNTAGIVNSTPAAVRVISRSYAGVYFGTFSAGLGNFAMFVRNDNRGVFLGYVPGSTAPVMTLDLSVNDSGGFSFSQAQINTNTSGEQPRAAALAPVTVVGTIGTDGNISGSIVGGAAATLSGSRSPDSGVTQGVAGFYQAGGTNSSAAAYAIVNSAGQSLVVLRTATSSDGGPGTANANGQVTATTTRSNIILNINPIGIVSGTSSGPVTATYVGASDDQVIAQRLVNISSRARIAGGDSVAIAGFVIAGDESKPVLIRAVGPTLGSFGVTGALAAPRVELFRGNSSQAVNTGIAGNRVAIDAAGERAGAFTLGAAGTDAAILTTLAPGNYTAVVSSANNTAGVTLIEVYDLSAATVGQKLLNIATRAPVGTGNDILIAGFVVPPGAPKRVLVRAVGPGLTPFGVTGVLAQPALTLLSGSTPVASNTNWSTSADSAAIPAASAQVGAFGLSNGDSALIATLPPGNYTAQVAGAGANATGVALIEVYELP